MPRRDGLPAVAGELAIVLIVSAVIGTYMLSQSGQAPGAPVSQSAALLAAFYFPMAFPVDAFVKATPLGSGAQSIVTLFATVTLQNVLLWLAGRWIARSKRAA